MGAKYIVCTFGLADVLLTDEQVSDLLARDVIYPVPEQPDDGDTSFYVNGYDSEDDRRIMAREGLIPKEEN